MRTVSLVLLLFALTLCGCGGCASPTVNGWHPKVKTEMDQVVALKERIFALRPYLPKINENDPSTVQDHDQLVVAVLGQRREPDGGGVSGTSGGILQRPDDPTFLESRFDFAGTGANDDGNVPTTQLFGKIEGI